MDKYPKILIFGQPFNNFEGGGITLTNLFKGWPKDRIAVASTGHSLYQVTTEVCSTYYRLGEEERRWRFPFNFIQRAFPSGLISFDKQENIKQIPNKTSTRQIIVDRFFFPFIHWFGLFHSLSKISLSQHFKEWLSVYQPEILYIQVSSREAILFSIQLCDYLGIPAVIHMMDDWPSTISKDGLLKKYWKAKIDKEFKQLLNRVDLYLSISNAMTSEYKNRYNKVFEAFHNPIETEAWQPYCKTNFKINYDQVKILYSGRIGPGITGSLVEIASVIDAINNTWGKIKLFIQTPSKDFKILSRLQKYKCIVINPVAEYSDLPKIFSQADILIIANDFDKQGIDFLKYSMPTKASEYMISGTPVLVYSPFEAAVARFFSDNECGFCVTEQKPEKLNAAIKLLVNDEEYRIRISNNAVRLAKELFDAEKVREKFQQLLINTIKKESYVQK